MMYPWQLDMMKKLEGFKPGEMTVMMAGRGVGKSSITALHRLWNDVMDRPITDITIWETKLHGARLWGARPDGGRWFEMETWCTEKFGKPGSVWDDDLYRWYMNDRTFYFREERDLTMFVLKWR